MQDEILMSPPEELVKRQARRVLAMIERDETGRRPAQGEGVARRRRARLALAVRSGAVVVCVFVLPR